MMLAIKKKQISVSAYFNELIIRYSCSYQYSHDQGFFLLAYVPNYNSPPKLPFKND